MPWREVKALDNRVTSGVGCYGRGHNLEDNLYAPGKWKLKLNYWSYDNHLYGVTLQVGYDLGELVAEVEQDLDEICSRNFGEASLV